MSTTNVNIFSAAFISPCKPNLFAKDQDPVSNPYYWHGRKEFNHKAIQRTIGFGEPATDNQELASFSLPFSNAEGPIPDIGTDNNQLALFPTSDGGNNPDGNSLAFSSKLDETFDSEKDLFASLEGGGAEQTSSTNLFSVADLDTLDGSGDTTLSFSDVGSNNIFSKRRTKKARAV